MSTLPVLTAFLQRNNAFFLGVPAVLVSQVLSLLQSYRNLRNLNKKY